MKLFLSSAQQLQSHTVCGAGYDVVRVTAGVWESADYT